MKKKKICPECGNYRIIIEQITDDVIIESWDRIESKKVYTKKSGRVIEHVCRTCFEKDKIGVWTLRKEYR